VLRGEVIDRTHPSYDDARRVWSGLIDRYPAVIARWRPSKQRHGPACLAGRS
jgi:hypothetical protein